MRTLEVESRVLPLRYTAVVRGEVRRDALESWLAGTYRAVSQYLWALGVPMVGRPFARFTFLVDEVAIEAGFPVPYEVPGDGVVEASTLPDGPAAVSTRWGPHTDLDRTDRVVREWLAERGYEPAGPHWEVYYNDPHGVPDPAFWRTDVVMPYRAAQVPARVGELRPVDDTVVDGAVDGERPGQKDARRSERP